MSVVGFLTCKDPVLDDGGDVTLSRLMMAMVREQGHTVLCVAQSPHATAPDEPWLVRVRKDPVSSPRIALESVGRRRSLTHVRFDTPQFRAALESLEADVYVAEHSYSAESFLRSSRAHGPGRLIVNTHIAEGLVWKQRVPWLGHLEARRAYRDELRVARRAHTVSCYDAGEAAHFRANGVRRALWLDVTLPPAPRVARHGTPPVLAFLGDRRWPPNARAAATLLGMWPEIGRDIPDAGLLLIGRPAGGRRPLTTPPGAVDLGFVEDLQGVLRDCRALAAPIQMGGGVRVKILDAASTGLPVVSTSAGIGSLGPLLGLTAFDDRAAFIARCRRLLVSPQDADEEGARLHRANADHWSGQRPQETVADWLGLP